MEPVAERLGRPMANLIVNVSFDPARYAKRETREGKVYEEAVIAALNYFGQPLTLTENGFLIADVEQNLPVLTALLEVTDNVARLACLDRLVREEIESHKLGGVHLHGLPYGLVTIVYEKPHLRLEELPEALRKWVG